MVKMGGSISVYGVLGSEKVTINKSDGPYNFNLLIHQWPTRWREREAQEPLSGWIRQGKLKASEFVTHQFKMDQIDEALSAIKSGQVAKGLLRY
jgi:alcohol dehydrogenase